MHRKLQELATEFLYESLVVEYGKDGLSPKLVECLLQVDHRGLKATKHLTIHFQGVTMEVASSLSQHDFGIVDDPVKEQILMTLRLILCRLHAGRLQSFV